MKNKKWILLLLIVLTAAVAIVHVTTRESAPAGTVVIEYQGQEAVVPLRDLEMVDIDEELTDAKGDTFRLTAQGVPMREVLRQGIGELPADAVVKVIASDEYSAEVTAAEVQQGNKVLLILQEDERLEMVVVGDSDRRRNVANVERLQVR